MYQRNVPVGSVVLLALFTFLAWPPSAMADETLYRYDGDVLPYDASAGWVIADPCEPPCDESLNGGHFVNHWAEVGDLVNYHYWIAREPDAPPPRCGWSGVFAPTTHLGPSSTAVTPCSPSITAQWPSLSTYTVMP